MASSLNCTMQSNFENQDCNFEDQGFDEWFIFRQQNKEKSIQNILDFVVPDKQMSDYVFVDVGCGTGEQMKEIAHRDIFSSFIAVEPNEDLLKEVDVGVRPLTKHCMTGEEFAKLSSVEYDVMLIDSTIHYFPSDSLGPFFRNVYKQFRPGGRIIIATRGLHCPFPVWDALRQAWTDQSKDFSPEILTDQLTSAGFVAQDTVKHNPEKLTREGWVRMLKRRFISTLIAFSDSEIELGIKSMDYPDVVSFSDAYHFVVGEKPITRSEYK